MITRLNLSARFAPLTQAVRSAYARHRAFLVLALLFVSFRLLTILLLRAGGLIADFSDQDYYYAWGHLVTAKGYVPYETLWSVYPPLFPALMLAIFRLTSAIPHWSDPRLFFHVVLSAAMLVFETGNLVLIYRLAGKLGGNAQWTMDNAQWDEAAGSASTHQSTNQPITPSPLHPLIAATLYALLFTPVFTMQGWFEAMPLFFMLLGLDLLISGKRRGWMGSALITALGVLTKLTPILLLPIAVRWLGAKFSWSAARTEWFNRRSTGNLLRPIFYGLLFAAVTVGGGLAFAGTDPLLVLSNLRIQALRPPWQTLYAALDGYFGFDLVPLDLRNVAGLTTGNLWHGNLPGWFWPVQILAFSALFLWLYTRPYDWSRRRTPVAFAGISLIWLFLYNKGWSPQFLVWILAFVVLLRPSVWTLSAAVLLSLLNFVETSVFLVMLPDQHWLLWFTTILRMLLLILLGMEFLAQIWPKESAAQAMHRISRWSAWGVMISALVFGSAVTPRLAHAYADRRLAENPCLPAITFLQKEASGPNTTIAMEQLTAWELLYPWLHQEFTLTVLDNYSPKWGPAEVLSANLDALSRQGEFWWVEAVNGAGANPAIGAEVPLAGLFFSTHPQVQKIENQQLGQCMVSRVVRADEDPLATANLADGSGPIILRNAEMDLARPGEPLHVVLYWQADDPVAQSYTVFTQLFDSAGQMVAQQDNLPVRGLAPTNTWQPGLVIRDPYELQMPATVYPDGYRLLVGLYTTPESRIPLTLPDGSTADYVVLPVRVETGK